MSVILGLNLSDRIYLLADSRVSYEDKATKKTVVKHDNMMKIEPLEELDACVIASAGDAKFAQFIINGINRDFSSADINKLRAEVEDWAKEQAHQYFQKYNSHANFIIAGIDDSRKNKILANGFFQVVDDYGEGKPFTGRMKTLLANALKNRDASEDTIQLNSNANVLFSLRINYATGVELEDAEWGEVLISGPAGVSKEDIGNKDIGRFEFEFTPGDDIQEDSLLLIAILDRLIQRKNLENVGGAHVPMCLFSNKLLATLNKRIYSSNPDGSDPQFVSAYTIKNNQFYRLDENEAEHLMEKVSLAKFDDKTDETMYTV